MRNMRAYNATPTCIPYFFLSLCLLYFPWRNCLTNTTEWGIRHRRFRPKNFRFIHIFTADPWDTIARTVFRLWNSPQGLGHYINLFFSGIIRRDRSVCFSHGKVYNDDVSVTFEIDHKDCTKIIARSITTSP